MAAALLVLPLLISVANALRVRNCSFAVGFAFFALLPLATVVYAAPAGVLAALAVPRRGRLVAFAIPVVSLVWSLVRLYRDPAVFAFDPFGGYFPGPIYDEALRPPLTLLCFRLVNLVWIATAVTIGMAAVGRGRDPRRWRPGPLAAAVPLVAASVALYAMGGTFQFRITRGDLEQALDRTLTTDHFVVHYARGAKSRADVALTAEDLEFRYHQLRDRLDVQPKLPITVWEFPSADVKKALVGAGGTLYARPWTREIFVQTNRFPARVLQHEMAHVFAGTFGDRWFGMSLAWRWHGPLPLPAFSVGLIEGVAEAVSGAADPDGDATIHEESRAMIEAGLAPPLASVVGASFSTLAGRRAYTIAGSFSAFLLATRGAEKLRALYRSAGNFTDVYRVPLADLEAEWRQFLARQPLTTRERAQASEEFRRPAIFKRVCARELAARLVEARAIEHDDPARAVALLEATCRDDPQRAHLPAGARGGAGAGGRTRARAGDAGPAGRRRRHHGAAARAGRRAGGRDQLRGARLRARRQRGKRAPPSWRRRRPNAGKRWRSWTALASPTARATLGRALFGDEVRTAGRGSGADVLPDHRIRAPGPDRHAGAVPRRPPAAGARSRARPPPPRARLRRRTDDAGAGVPARVPAHAGGRRLPHRRLPARAHRPRAAGRGRERRGGPAAGAGPARPHRLGGEPPFRPGRGRHPLSDRRMQTVAASLAAAARSASAAT